MATSDNNGKTGGVTRVLAIMGFIAILAIGMWGSIQIASAIPGAFSGLTSAIVSLTSIFVPAGETLTLSVQPSLSVASGNPLQVTWAHEKKTTDGSYTFRYDCAEGVYFTSPTPAGAEQTIYCNVPFNFLNANNAITLKAFSTANRFIDVTVYIDYTPNGANRPTVTGSTFITITNENLTGSPTVTTPTTTPSTPTKPTTPTTPRPTTPRTPGQVSTSTYPIGGGRVSDPNGYVDLSVKILETGVVDKTTGAFTASSTPSRSSRVAVRFAVENIGTKTSPQWNFNAVLPTIPSNIFSSPMQQALAPGDRIEFTIGFDSFDPAKPNGEFIVNVDPSNSFNEKREDNNIVKHVVTTVP